MAPWRVAASVLLLDLDGVVRHFDPSVADDLEVQGGLEIGSLRREAFEHPRGIAAITGGLTRAAWTEAVGRAVGSPDAARTWLGTRGSADPAMVELIRDVRRTGVRVAALTNGTDTIHDELADCGLDDAFDEVFCSWHIGVAKPDPAVYVHVCEALDVSPAAVVFFDDSERNVLGARDVGMTAELFRGPDQVRRAVVAD